MGYNTRNILCNLNEEIRKSGGGGGGTKVVANPSGPATVNLSKLQVGDGIYGVSNVKANVAVSTFAAPLTSLKVNDDEYQVLAGGGIPYIDDMTTPTLDPQSGRVTVSRGGYKVVGTKCYFNLILKLSAVITAASSDGTYTRWYDPWYTGVWFVPEPLAKTAILDLAILKPDSNNLYKPASAGFAYVQRGLTRSDLYFTTICNLDGTQDDIYLNIYGSYDVASV